MKKWLIGVISGGCLVVLFFFGYLGSAVFQEDHPHQLVMSVLKLEVTGKEKILYEQKGKRKHYISHNKGENRFDVVKEYMSSKGYEYQEQMGSGLIFIKDRETIVIETRQYSSHYFLWSISELLS